MTLTALPPTEVPPLELNYAQRRLVRGWLAKWNPVGLMRKTFAGVYAAARCAGLEDADIGQAAVDGVCKAALRYKPGRLSARTGKPTPFATFANWYVRAAVQDAIDDANGFTFRHDDEPGDRPKTVSFDATTKGKDGGTRWQEQLADPREDEALEAACRAEARQTVARLLESLDGRTRRVLTLRFGIGGGRPKTLDQIGAEVGVCKERIRQLSEKAFERLREKAGV